jgi:cysteine desulfurase
MIYLDSAATTALDEHVKQAMIEVLDVYGNPSSTHELGRKARIEIEKTRKLIADELNCAPGEIFFTSGGTEADNIALLCSVRDLGVTHIITSPIEHKAVLETAKWLAKRGEVRLTLLSVDQKGNIDLNELKEALQTDDKTLVSLMYANNEIGTVNPMHEICDLAKAHDALVHSDTVQAICHKKIDLQALPLDFLACAAHKFHGPKGVGFCFVRGGLKIAPQIMGGGQERNMRAGTENIVGIVGLGKAFERAYRNLEEDRQAIREIKRYAIACLSKTFDDIVFLGESGDVENSLFTVLNVGFPNDGDTTLMIFSLDMKGIAVSGGSACNSGSSKGSHVIAALGEEYQNRVPVRISFSKYNSKADIDKLIEALVEIRQPIGAQ